MSRVSTELEYQRTPVSHPSYQLSLLTQQSGGQQVTLNAAGGQQSIFEIPANIAYNLSKSVLTFSYTIPDLDENFNIAYTDCIAAINQLTLYTRANILLCDIPNFQYYTKVMFNTDTHINEFLTKDHSNLLFRNNDLVSDEITTNKGVRPNGGPNNGNLRSATSGNLNYTEPAYITASIVGDGAGAGDLKITVNILMGQLKNTIFSCDKDLLFNEIIYLRIYWAPFTALGYTTTNGPGSNTGIAALATAFNINNLYFYLAVDQDANITNALKARTMSAEGFNVLVDYTTPNLQNFVAGITNQTVSYKINRGNGMRLKRIYHSLFNGSYSTGTAATLAIRFDHNNLPNDAATATYKVGNYYTMLDNKRIQQFNIDCTNYNDWMIHQDLLADSVLQNANIYKYNWVHIESFDGMKTTEHDNNQEVGLDLTLEKKWDFVGSLIYDDAAVPMNHFTFLVTQKILTVSPAGITIT